jgi:hypothetical protein
MPRRDSGGSDPRQKSPAWQRKSLHHPPGPVHDDDPHRIVRPAHGSGAAPEVGAALYSSDDGATRMERAGSLGTLRSSKSGSISTSKADLLRGITDDPAELAMRAESPAGGALPPLRSPPPSRQRNSQGLGGIARPAWDSRPGETAQPKQYPAMPNSRRREIQMRR